MKMQWIAYIAMLLSILIFTNCGSLSTNQKIVNQAVSAYEIDYNAYNNTFKVQSIDVTPPYSGQNFPGKAGIFQIGNAIFSGNLITVTAYIINNDTQPWTGVVVQAYQLLSGNNVTVYDPDFGTGWYVNNPAYGAWGWLFTSGTQGSEFTIPAGGRSANKINGFYTLSNFRAWVYIYANVPVISGINPSLGLIGSSISISGYNFSTTQGNVIFNGASAPIVNWTDNTITATVPANATLGNVVIGTVWANTPYSNMVPFTPYKIFASLTTPGGITVDTSGNLYVPNYSSNLMNKISPSGVITTYPANKNYNIPLDVALDTGGNLYIANQSGNNILKIPAGKNAPVIFAKGLNGPDALYFSAAGQSWPLFVANGGNGTISMISSNGTVTQFASGFTNPTAIVTDASGNVYVGDCSNGNVYKIDPTGTTIVSVTSSLSCPAGMKLDNAGNIYILDSGTDIIYKYSPSTGYYSPYAGGTGISNTNGGFAFDDTFTTLYVSEDSPTNEVISIPLK